MVSRKTARRYCLTLGVGLCLFAAGCTKPFLHRDGVKKADRPPEPGAALLISGPAKGAAPALTTAQVQPPTAPLQTLPLPALQVSLTPVSPTPVQDITMPSTMPPLVVVSPPGSGVFKPTFHEVPAMPPLVAAPQAPEDGKTMAPLRDLHQKAAQKYASLDSYLLRLRRREVVHGQNHPEEVMLCKFRKEPWSVYFKWLGPEAKGREVVYVKGAYGNMIHSLTAAGDVPFLPAGKRFNVSPDSFLVKSKSRYPITDAGLGPLIDRFGRLAAAFEQGDMREGTAKYLGQLKRPEFDTMVEAVMQVLPPKSDPNLPRGGQRLWFFDPAIHLPVLVITQDETGREVEYYCHDRFQFPVRLDDDDFNPEVLWRGAK